MSGKSYVRHPYEEPGLQQGWEADPLPDNNLIEFFHPQEPEGNPILSLYALEHSQLSARLSRPTATAPFAPHGHTADASPIYALSAASAVSTNTAQWGASSSTPAKWGVYHRTALIACGILANNRFDGYFLSFRYKMRINEEEELLTEPRYLFAVPGISNYPVVEDFRSWQFPHGELPPPWNFTIPHNPGKDIHGRSSGSPGSACAVTNAHCALEHCHIIPQCSWFWMNHMARDHEPFNTSTTQTKNIPTNFLTLRADIRKLFTDNRICIVPKTVMVEPDDMPTYSVARSRPVHLVLCVLLPDNQSYGQLYKQYHNISLHQLQDVSPDYLFAAFAQNIFMRSSYFQRDNRPRHAIKLEVLKHTGARYITYVRMESPDDKDPTEQKRSSKKRSWVDYHSNLYDGTDNAGVENQNRGVSRSTHRQSATREDRTLAFGQLNHERRSAEAYSPTSVYNEHSYRGNHPYPHDDE
ncbi:hypothetical protein F5Y01DRAFT_322787 [Xylaria sp. FL0043]|nr:hypothetical protein F5Y01DRAFT_322787 [Xylaria sp. FL0043]